MGRDPVKHPLTPLELSMFGQILHEMVKTELTARDENELATGVPGGAV